jgi:hypothetical protein
VRRLLVTDSDVPNSLIVVTLMKEALSSSETSVLTRASQGNIPEDGILQHFLVLFQNREAEPLPHAACRGSPCTRWNTPRQRQTSAAFCIVDTTNWTTLQRAAYRSITEGQREGTVRPGMTPPSVTAFGASFPTPDRTLIRLLTPPPGPYRGLING